MKLKNIIPLLFMTILIICTISCSDDMSNENLENLPSDESTSIEIEKETLYNYQTNKNMILYSLIRYNHEEKKFFIDATEKDKERLGITTEAYEEGLKYVEQLNQIDIERQ